MSEKSGVEISDSVVMGDVQQNITNVHQHIDSSTSCERCDAINVRIFGCVSPGCKTQFCEVCHAYCKWTEEGAGRYDSDGEGPFCQECMEQHLLQWEVDDAALQMNDRLIGLVLFSVLLLFIALSGLATGFWSIIFFVDPICGVPLGGLALVVLGRYLASRNRYTTALRNVS